MKNKTSYFALQLAGVLLFLAVLHLAYLYARSLALPFDLIILGYAVNFGMALIIYFALVKFAERQSKSLGFLFLFGSTLKFAVYFVIFNPLFMKDGGLSKLEFFTFFLPYLACLLVETLALVKLLNEID